jgi:alpha-tubulin suppressor-like RCC1 family protein
LYNFIFLRIQNNIICSSGDGSNTGIKPRINVLPVIEHNNFYNVSADDYIDTNGNISVNPEFADDEYHLGTYTPQSVSHGGKDLSPYGVAVDRENHERTPPYSMGAYEYSDLPPVVYFTEPVRSGTTISGPVVSGTIRVRIEMSDDLGLYSYTYHIDDIPIEEYDPSYFPKGFFIHVEDDGCSAYAYFHLDTTKLENGRHTIEAFVTDTGGHTSSDEIAITITNEPPPPIDPPSPRYLAAGYMHTLGLTRGRTVVSAGRNNYGQCDVGNWSDIVQITAGYYHSVGLKSDGTVVAAGYNSSGQCNVSEWTDIVQISAGGHFTLGLKADGTVVATGSKNYGQCNVSNWNNIIQIDAGCYHSGGLKSDGTVVATGYTSGGRCNTGEWEDITAIGCSVYHTFGITSSGTVVPAGTNYYGQCDIDDFSDIIQMDSGSYHTIGLKSDGTLLTAGLNYYGECDVDDWEDIIEIISGLSLYCTFGLKSDGTVVATGKNNYGQYDVENWSNIGP